MRVTASDAPKTEAGSVIVRRWCKNPSGKQWADMRRETLIREGVELEHPPPMELHDEAAASTHLHP